jgi:hypothetical protein
MQSGHDFPIDDWGTRDKDFATVSDRCFSRKVFHPYPSLRLRHPQNGLNQWKPYRGEAFDGDEWELEAGGWDHEHCSLCFAKILDGMSYWVNAGEVTILCDYCRNHYAEDLVAPPSSS